MERIRSFFSRMKESVLSWWNDKLTYSWRSVIRMIIIAAAAFGFFYLVPQALQYALSFALLWGIFAIWAFAEELVEEVTEKRNLIDREFGMPAAPAPAEA